MCRPFNPRQIRIVLRRIVEVGHMFVPDIPPLDVSVIVGVNVFTLASEAGLRKQAIGRTEMTRILLLVGVKTICASLCFLSVVSWILILRTCTWD